MTTNTIDGMPIVEAKKHVVLEITASDIKKGNSKDPANCAAAIACMRQLGAVRARVHISRTYLQLGRKWVRFHTPISLRSEIVAFDRGGSFAPGEYVLTPMQPTKRTGKRQGSMKKVRRGKKRAPYHVVTGIRAHGANR